MSFSYDYYRVFYRVAEHGNITAAARELFLAQSTVSRTIQNLEFELGCRLLCRSTQGIRLTEEGDILYRHLKAAFEHIQVAGERLDSLRRLNEGMLCIGASECMRILRQPLFPKTHLFRQNSSVTAMAVCKRIKSGSRLRRGELGA